jgi:chemotaxis protein methyltransferase CheR
MTAARDLFSELVSEVCTIVNRLSGIQLNAEQQHMVQSRLRSRMLSLGLPSPEAYMDYLHSNLESESQALVSLMTTHFSFFFREAVHFDFLEKSCLPELIKVARTRPDKKIRFWSAACSRGQEAYSLAMFLSFHLATLARDVDFEILATDVDPESVTIAENGVYPMSELKRVPKAYIASHWAQGKDEIKNFVAARDSLRSKIKFGTLNLVTFDGKTAKQKFDVIFCRNVFIYFNAEQIKNCIKNFFEVLEPSGRLFVGVSEALAELPPNIVNKGFSVYGRSDAKDDTTPGTSTSKIASISSAQTQPAPVSPLAEQIPLRVVCVDDSDSILMLLKKILTKDYGFEVVGTAPNGKAAVDVISLLKPDLVTLDIHMPEMDGVQYMETKFNANHPPVVMISSVPREEADLAVRTLKSGASDYVEKPTLNNLSEQADEIRSKLILAAATRSRPSTISFLDQAFAKHIKLENPATKLRVIVAGVSHVKDVNVILSNLQDDQCPTLVLVDGSESLMDVFTKELRCGRYQAIGMCVSANAVAVNQVGMMHFKSSIDKVRQDTTLKRLAICVLGVPSQAIVDKLSYWSNAEIILEDMDGKRSKSYERARAIAADVMPVASMAYMSTTLLNKK